MNSRVLARLYRPKSFETVVGQEIVVKALSNAINQNRLHHAYLLTGTRGVGKTTIARILAKCLNCETGQTSTPCEQCPTCTQINDNRFLDLIEIDAASKTKVEDTRDLLDNVQYAPNQGRMKVYLIDEVHMLSNHSFNALLKTLEEPPSHCIFILATTDPQKIPATIISRCIQLKLSPLNTHEIEQQLAWVLKQESINFAQDALKLIAKAACGSMRDALSLTDQAIAYNQSDITYDATAHMLGVASSEPLLALFEAILLQDASTILAQVELIKKEGAKFDAVLETLLSLFHIGAMRQVISDYPCDALPDDKRFNEALSSTDAASLQLFYQIALRGRQDLAISPDMAMSFEMTLLRMVALNAPQTNASTRPTQTASPQTASNQKTPQESKQAPTPNTAAAQTTIEINPATLASEWHEIVKKLPLSGLSRSLINQSTVIDCSPPQLTLNIPPNFKSMLTPDQQKNIDAVLTSAMSCLNKVTLQFEESATASPQDIAEKTKADKLNQDKATLMQSPLTQDIVSEMGGVIVDETVKSH